MAVDHLVKPQSIFRPHPEAVLGQELYGAEQHQEGSPLQPGGQVGIVPACSFHQLPKLLDSGLCRSLQFFPALGLPAMLARLLKGISQTKHWHGRTLRIRRVILAKVYRNRLH